jgi:hypothetical protein
VEAFIRKWDANAQASYTNTSPTDQTFIQDFTMDPKFGTSLP